MLYLTTMNMFAALVFLLASAANATDAPLADFGDAPDGVDAGYGNPSSGVIGNFPTSFATSNSRWGRGGRSGACI